MNLELQSVNLSLPVSEMIQKLQNHHDMFSLSVTNCRCSQSESDITLTAVTTGGVVAVVLVLIVSITVATVIVILLWSRRGRNSTGLQNTYVMSYVVRVCDKYIYIFLLYRVQMSAANKPHDLSKTSKEATFM